MGVVGVLPTEPTEDSDAYTLEPLRINIRDQRSHATLDPTLLFVR